MARYARRESFEYRALWTSEVYQDLCIMANPKVPADKVAAVRAALINMLKDPEGRQILEAGARMLKKGGERRFSAGRKPADDHHPDVFKSTPALKSATE